MQVEIKSYTAYLAVDLIIYNKIMSMGKMFVRRQRYSVYEELNLKR